MSSRFEIPIRRTKANGDVVFEIPIRNECLEPLGIVLEVQNERVGMQGWKPSMEQIFLTFREKILKDLTNETSLFRNPPTLKILLSMTTNWYSDLQKQKISFGSVSYPCSIDLCLASLHVSRSHIEPVWKTVFIRRVHEIDFEWSAPANDLEEVSDVPSAGALEPFVLTDPDVKERAKLAAKTHIRTLFTSAANARMEAETAAAAFFDTYDVSDSESTFSEWLDDEG